MKHFIIKPKSKGESKTTVYLCSSPDEMFDMFKKAINTLEKNHDVKRVGFSVTGFVYDTAANPLFQQDTFFVKYRRTFIKHSHSMTKNILKKELISYKWYEMLSEHDDDVIVFTDKRTYATGTSISISRSEFVHFCHEIEDKCTQMCDDDLDMIIRISVAYGETWKDPKHTIYALGDYKHFNALEKMEESTWD